MKADPSQAMAGLCWVAYVGREVEGSQWRMVNGKYQNASFLLERIWVGESCGYIQRAQHLALYRYLLNKIKYTPN